jgi:hypothetical protein
VTYIFFHYSTDKNNILGVMNISLSDHRQLYWYRKTNITLIYCPIQNGHSLKKITKDDYVTEVGPVRFQTEPNRNKPNRNRFGSKFLRNQVGSVRFGLRIFRFDSVRLDIFKKVNRFGSVRFGLKKSDVTF